jgi:hypothetical protein
MRWSLYLIAVQVVLAAPAMLAAQSAKPARIEIDLATEEGGAPTVAQQWYQLLTDLKVSNLRIRGAGSGETPKIESVGSAEAPVYKVQGLLTRNGELLLPGGRFRAADKARVAEWLSKLRREGPDRARGGRPLPFGLTKEQLAQVHQDLARPVLISTKGIRPSDFVHRTADTLHHPLSGEAAAAALLEAAPPLDVELRGLAAGTALAYTLESLGLSLVPQLDARRQPSYAISPRRQKQERWPVGWPAREPRRDLMPSLFDSVDVELTDVELPRVLAAVAEHVAAPLLIDDAALTAEKIDLSKIKVSQPAKRSMYDIVLRRVLVPQRVTHEVLVDEANKPFLWITTARKAAEAQAKNKEPAR